MKWSIWVAVAIAVIALTAVVTGVVQRAKRGPEDNGRMVRDSVELYYTPRTVRVVATSRVKDEVLHQSTSWWNEAGVPERFYYTIDDELYEQLHPQLADSYGLVLVDVAQVSDCPEDTECGGVTFLVFDQTTGEIVAASVMLNALYAYNDETMTGAAKHEFGHVLGLADDPLPGLDINSIMRLRVNPGGILTPHDRRVLNRRPHGRKGSSGDTGPASGVHRSGDAVPQHRTRREEEQPLRPVCERRAFWRRQPLHCEQLCGHS